MDKGRLTVSIFRQSELDARCLILKRKQKWKMRDGIDNYDTRFIPDIILS